MDIFLYLLALVCGAASLVGMLAGRTLAVLIPVGLVDVAAGLALVCIGMYILYSAFMPPRLGLLRHPAFYFACVGIGTGLAGYSPILLPLTSVFLGFGLLWLTGIRARTLRVLTTVAVVVAGIQCFT